MAISIDDIKDEKSLEAWLNERPEAVRQNCAVFIAARAALRVLPYTVFDLQFSNMLGQQNVTSVTFLKSALITSVAAEFPSDASKIKEKFSDLIVNLEFSDATSFAAAFATAFAILAFKAHAPSVEGRGMSSSAVQLPTFSVELYDSSANAMQTVWAILRADLKHWMKHAAGDGACGIDIAPLDLGGIELNPGWPTVREKLLNDTDPDRGADWSFWVDWYDKILRGDPQDWDVLYEIAVSDDIDWEASPREVNAAIAWIVQRYRAHEYPTALSKASVFDFLLENERLRLVGFPSDLGKITNQDTIREFVQDTENLCLDLSDWIDYAEDEVRTKNIPSPLLKAVTKLHDELRNIPNTQTINLRRLVSLGGDVRRFSIDTGQRDQIGNSLAELLDQRMACYAELAGKYFGPIFALLEPLKRLELGDLEPADLVHLIKHALHKLDQEKDENFVRLNDPSRAILEELVRELEEIMIEASAQPDGEKRAFLRKRFAEKFGGLGTTLARYVEKGVQFSKKTGSVYDEAIIWSKRAEKFSDIVDFLEKILNGG